ncbi:MAG: zf-HC2 domain-containing protein [Nitrososphaerota archaeon]
MDNDTIKLTCEQAEDELSGYLDDVLDLRLRRQVEAHLATCDRCQEILADFRQGDELLRALPFIEPPADMRDRFFNSPRYLKLANARARGRNFVTPLTAALVAAAMLVVALGGALLFRQGALGSQQANRTGFTTTIGNPDGGAPLPAGPRLIYERNGALWSAAENGAGLPQQLTPAGIQVAGWSVSPNGRTILYIDAHSGALHTIRADALNDDIVGTVTGGHAPAADFWTTPAGVEIAGGLAWSPDNTRVAYLAQSGDGTALHVTNATGAADTVVNAASGVMISRPLWSADSIYIAYTTTRAGAQGIGVYNVTTAHAVLVAAHSDPRHGSAVVGELAWVPNRTPATITWSAGVNGAITGIFRADATTSDSTMSLTAAGASYTAADVSATGAWLLASGHTLFTIAPDQTAARTVATLAHPVAQIHWAPSSQLAAVVSDGTLALLRPGGPMVMVARGLTAQSLVAWAPDGGELAWQSDDAVMTVQVHQGVAGAAKLAAHEVDAQALVWSSDGQSLAVRSSTGLLLVSADGAHIRATDSHATRSSKFAWSLAG